MQFTQDLSSGINVIRAYGGGEMRVNENSYRGAVILSASTVIAEPNIHNLEDLIAVDGSRILALEPELVLLGTGSRQIFPAASFSRLHPSVRSFYAQGLVLKSWIPARPAGLSTYWWPSTDRWQHCCWCEAFKKK